MRIVKNAKKIKKRVKNPMAVSSTMGKERNLGIVYEAMV
jgi:hypothetical protein